MVISYHVQAQVQGVQFQAQIDHFNSQGQLMQTINCTHACQGLQVMNHLVFLIENGLFWISYTSEKCYLFKFNLIDGALIWSQAYTNPIKQMIWTLTKSDHMLYLLMMGSLSTQWKLYVINPQGQTTQQIMIAPVVANQFAHQLIVETNHLYVLIHAEQDYCLEVGLQGTILQRWNTPRILHDLLIVIKETYLLVSQRYHPQHFARSFD